MDANTSVNAWTRRPELAERPTKESPRIHTGGAAHPTKSAGFRLRTAGVVQQGAPTVSPTMDGKGDPVYSRAFELRLNVEQLRRERRVIEKALADQPKSGLPVEALAVLPTVQASPELNTALQEINQKEADLR